MFLLGHLCTAGLYAGLPEPFPLPPHVTCLVILNKKRSRTAQMGRRASPGSSSWLVPVRGSCSVVFIPERGRGFTSVWGAESDTGMDFRGRLLGSSPFHPGGPRNLCLERGQPRRSLALLVRSVNLSQTQVHPALTQPLGAPLCPHGAQGQRTRLGGLAGTGPGEL